MAEYPSFDEQYPDGVNGSAGHLASVPGSLGVDHASAAHGATASAPTATTGQAGTYDAAVPPTFNGFANHPEPIVNNPHGASGSGETLHTSVAQAPVPDPQANQWHEAEGHGSDSFGTDSRGTDSYGAGSYGAGSYGADSHGTDSYGADSYATDTYGADSYGADSYGTDSYGTDSYGADSYGTDSYGADSYGTDSYGTDSYGADSYGGYDAIGAAAAVVPPAPTPPPDAIRVSIAVVEANPAIRDGLLARLGGSGTPFGSVEELASRLTGSVPVVVVLGPSCGTPASLALVEHLIGSHESLGAILVTDELTTSLLQQSMRIGIKDVLTIPGDIDQITAAIQRVAVGLDAARRSVPPVGHDQPGPIATDVGQERGDVITVFSTKGGAGKSVLATNLAVALAQKSAGPVCLVDADLQFGDVAVMLKLTPHHTIVDAVASLDRMDAALLDSLLVTHEPSGLKVLPAPLEPAFADQVGAAEMVAIVDQLRQYCSYVIVDTPAYFNDVVLGLVEVSDKVVLVAGMDIPNIKNVKIGLQTLRLLNTPMDKLMLVLNRSNSKVKLDIGEVERTLQVKADALIPSDVLIPQSVNKGVPVILHAPRSPVAKSIQQMAELFLPANAKRR